MKSLQTLAFTLLASLALTAAASAAEDVTKLLSDAQTAYLRNEVETAKSLFEMVNKLDPKNQVAIAYLRRIQAEQAQRGVGTMQEKKFAALIIPKVEFREATLGAALDAIKKKADEASGGKLPVNFVLQLPEDVVKTQQVTLNLTNVPFTEVLRYLGGLANISFAYDRYAIVVKPAGGSSVKAEPTPK
jgi:hypothetical protein